MLFLIVIWYRKSKWVIDESSHQSTGILETLNIANHDRIPCFFSANVNPLKIEDELRREVSTVHSAHVGSGYDVVRTANILSILCMFGCENNPTSSVGWRDPNMERSLRICQPFGVDTLDLHDSYNFEDHLQLFLEFQGCICFVLGNMHHPTFSMA